MKAPFGGQLTFSIKGEFVVVKEKKRPHPLEKSRIQQKSTKGRKRRGGRLSFW